MNPSFSNSILFSAKSLEYSNYSSYSYPTTNRTGSSNTYVPWAVSSGSYVPPPPGLKDADLPEEERIRLQCTRTRHSTELYWHSLANEGTTDRTSVHTLLTLEVVKDILNLLHSREDTLFKGGLVNLAISGKGNHLIAKEICVKAHDLFRETYEERMPGRSGNDAIRSSGEMYAAITSVMMRYANMHACVMEPEDKGKYSENVLKEVVQSIKESLVLYSKYLQATLITGKFPLVGSPACHESQGMPTYKLSNLLDNDRFKDQCEDMENGGDDLHDLINAIRLLGKCVGPDSHIRENGMSILLPTGIVAARPIHPNTERYIAMRAVLISLRATSQWDINSGFGKFSTTVSRGNKLDPPYTRQPVRCPVSTDTAVSCSHLLFAYEISRVIYEATMFNLTTNMGVLNDFTKYAISGRLSSKSYV